MPQRHVLNDRPWNVAVRRGSGDRASQAKLAIAIVALVVAFGLIAWNFGWLPFLESKPKSTPPTQEQLQQLEEQEKQIQRLEDEGKVIEGGA